MQNEHRAILIRLRPNDTNFCSLKMGWKSAKNKIKDIKNVKIWTGKIAWS